MTRKLFTFAKQECMEENPDSIMCQEVLTPGQLYLMFLKASFSASDLSVLMNSRNCIDILKPEILEYNIYF